MRFAVKGDWLCTECDYLNRGHRIRCGGPRCKAPKGPQATIIYRPGFCRSGAPAALCCPPPPSYTTSTLSKYVLLIWTCCDSVSVL